MGLKQKLRSLIKERSGGRCEAEVQTNSFGREYLNGWKRCAATATEIHHLLTRSRGGKNLDRVMETYHLIHLCSDCHNLCQGSEAYAGGMLIDGEVIWSKVWNQPVYRGTDEFLKEKYSSDSKSLGRLWELNDDEDVS